MDDDPEAIEIINEYIARGWLKEFPSAEALEAEVGGKPILNMFACLTKERWDPTDQQAFPRSRGLEPLFPVSPASGR